MIVAYTDFNHLLVILAVSSILGFAAALWSLRESWLDHRALRGSSRNNAAGTNVNVTALGEESFRIVVHVVFIAIGLMSMFWNPLTRDASVTKAIGYAFVLTPAVLGLASLFRMYMRRRLSALISDRKEAP